MKMKLNAIYSSFGEHYSSFAVFLLGAIALVVPSGYSVGSLLLLLASITLLWRRPAFNLQKQGKLLMLVLAVYSLLFIVQLFFEGVSSSAYDRPFRFLLALPVLLFILAYPPKLAALWAGLALGSILTGSWALWQNLVLNIDRAGGHTFVIQFGNISMLFGFFCLAGLGWAAVQVKPKQWLSLLLLGAFFGVLASLLSGSRGGWVGLPFIFLVIYRAYGQLLAVKFKLILLVIVLSFIALVYLIPQTGVKTRILHAFYDIELYFSSESKNTSLGLRFDMWQGAITLIIEKPLAGWGYEGYHEGMQALANQGEVTAFAVENHAHNDFLDTFARRGLFGLLTLLLLYLVPLHLFSNYLASPNMELRAVATAGALLPVAFIDFGLSQAFLEHNSGVMIYAFWLVVLWGCLRSVEKKDAA